MGYRGPIPKPSAIARAEGNPGKRRLNDFEPQPRATRPRCPDHLDAQAKKEWKRLIPILRRMKVLTEADGMTLANLCQAWSTLVKAQEKLTEMGILYKSPSGYVQQSPLFSMVNQCVDMIVPIESPRLGGGIVQVPKPDPGIAAESHLRTVRRKGHRLYCPIALVEQLGRGAGLADIPYSDGTVIAPRSQTCALRRKGN
jgi:P27 family predicted phage terminase small subunit